MKKFTFFLVLLIAIIAILFFGLIKNKLMNTPKQTNQEQGYIISESKGQSFSLLQKDDAQFELRGQVSDGTHSRVIVRVVDSTDTSKVISDDTLRIDTEPFTYDMDMPEDRDSVYINIYYKDDKELAVSLNAIRLDNDGGKWSIAQNVNTEENSKILGQGNPKDFVYSKDEFLQVPQGVLTLSDTITKAHTDDYDKAYAIYLWLCEHIFVTENAEDKSLEYVFNTRIADNESYVNYFAALLRAQDIPCTIVECDGYYFNEIYVSDKWINIQIDRDTFNKYTDGQYIYDRKNLYFHFGISDNIISSNYIVRNHKK